MDQKDWLLILTGAIAGIPAGILASILASVLQGPVLNGLAGHTVIRILSFVRPWRSSDFDGKWQMEWHVQSDRFPQINITPITFYPFWKFLSGAYSVTTSRGSIRHYRIVARITDGQRITGRWYDTRASGYHGALQMIISPAQEALFGRWIGFSSQGTVKSDNWFWRKSTAQFVRGGDETPVAVRAVVE